MARALVGTTRKAESPVLIEEAVGFAKKNDFLSIEIEALNTLGLYYYLKGFFSTATITFHKALVLSEKYGDELLIIQQINQMAIAQIEAGDYAQAEAHLLTMREIALRINAERLFKLSYANMAYSLINQKRYKEALPELEKYNELNKNTTELTNKVIEENMLSQVFFGIKDYTKAQYHIDQALLIADSIGYIDGMILTLKTLTELQFTTKDYDAAITTANRIIEHNESSGSDRFTIDALSYLSQAHEIKGNYKKALKYQQELLDQKKSVFSRDKQNISERLEIEYDIRTKENEREELLRNKERNETIIRQRTLLAVGTLAAAFLLIVVIYLLYRNLVYRKKNNEQLEHAVAERTKELEHLNKRLIQSNKELERFAFVASHDLKEPIRNLVSFSTLLSRQIEQQETPSKEYIDIIRKNAKNVFALVDGILNFSRIRKVNFNLVNIELASIIEEVKELIDTTLRQSNAVVWSTPQK